MAITVEQLVDVLVKHLPVEREGISVEEAKLELQQTLGEDPEALELLKGIADEIWQLGYEEGRKTLAP